MEYAKFSSSSDQAVQHVNRQDEQLWGPGVPPPQSTMVPYGWAWLAIHHHPRARRTQEYHKPIEKPLAATILVQDLKEEWPGDGIKRVGKIKLQEYPGFT
jgi:hypothetical protein